MKKLWWSDHCLFWLSLEGYALMSSSFGLPDNFLMLVYYNFQKLPLLIGLDAIVLAYYLIFLY